MVNQNMQSAEIRLNPAHLGPIEVRIEMDDEKVNVAFSSRHAAVREAVEMALPRLREMFESSGISLADANISQHTFAEQREQQLREEGINNMHMGSSHVTEDGSPQPDTDTRQTRNASSMIDYYI
jgi:flagellar hook-length control protein FliK